MHRNKIIIYEVDLPIPLDNACFEKPNFSYFIIASSKYFETTVILMILNYNLWSIIDDSYIIVYLKYKLHLIAMNLQLMNNIGCLIYSNYLFCGG